MEKTFFPIFVSVRSKRLTFSNDKKYPDFATEKGRPCSLECILAREAPKLTQAQKTNRLERFQAKRMIWRDELTVWLILLNISTKRR